MSLIMQKLDIYKDQFISKKIVMPRILPKNERMNSYSLVRDVRFLGESLARKTFRDYLTFRIKKNQTALYTPKLV